MTSKIRLYFSGKIKSDLISHLSKDQTHYLKDVMRLKIGEDLLIFNSQGEWEAVIENYDKDRTKIKILKNVRKIETEHNIWLAFSPIKQNSLNFMIQKGTELGIKKFIPIISDRTIVKEININRMKKIIVEACEQSNRISIPEIDNLITLKKFLSDLSKKACLVFCDINSDKKNLKNIFLKKPEGPICILIGPEGDFSEAEKNMIVNFNQSHSLSLANNILRSETAAIAAIAIVNYQLNQ